MPSDSTKQRAHLNLVASSRQLFELDPGVAIEAKDGWLLGAGTPTHPVISNAAFRADDGADPSALIAHAKDFFGARERGFSLWVRGEEPEDEGLAAAATAAGLRQVYAMPEMVLDRRPETPPLPEGAELRQLTAEDADGRDYWEIAASSYADLGWPPEAFQHYESQAGLAADNVAAFIAYLDGEPASIAMTIVSHGVAGIYWVGSLGPARGKGLGAAATAAATNAGFDLGADLASLQASPMGKPVYTAMGYETLFEYRLLLCSAP